MPLIKTTKVASRKERHNPLQHTLGMSTNEMKIKPEIKFSNNKTCEHKTYWTA